MISTTLVTWRDIQICSANNDTVISLDRSIVKQHYVISGFCLFMYVLVYYSYWLFLEAMISNVDTRGSFFLGLKTIRVITVTTDITLKVKRK